MAAGSIVIDLLMRTGSFETDTGRAEKRLKAFEKEVKAVGTAIGVTLSAAAVAGAAAFDQLIKSAANFKDLEEITGATAEGIASTAVALATAGVSADAFAGDLVKLTKNMTGLDDESKAAGAALASLGIPIKDFKALDPIAQIDKLTEAFGKFKDGPTKSAVAMALFGKSGAELLKVFKALEEQGGRQTILTQRQLELADEYADRQARLTAQLKFYAQAIAIDTLPAFNSLIEAVRDVVGNLGNVNAETGRLAANTAIRDWSQDAVIAIARVGESVAGLLKLTQAIGGSFQAVGADISFALDVAKTVGKTGTLGLAFDKDAQQQLKNSLDLRNKIVEEANQRYVKLFTDSGTEVSDLLGKRFAIGNLAQQAGIDSIDKLMAGKDGRPQLDYNGKTSTSTKTRGTGRSSAQSEADRYIESLQRQLDAIGNLTVSEQLLSDIQRGRLGNVSAAQQAQLVSLAEQIDGSRALKAAEEENTKAIEDQRRQYEAVTAEAARFFEETRTPVEQLNAGLEQQRRILEALGLAYEDTYNRKVAQLFATYDEGFVKAGKELDDFAKNAAESIQSALGDNLVDAMNGNFKDIGDNFLKLIQRMVAESLAADITRSLFGKGGDGSGFLGNALGTVGTFLGFGGAKAGGGDVMPGRSYFVGEQGPEMFVPRTVGTILPAAQTAAASGGGMTHITQNFSVSGQVDRRTQEQIAAQAGRAIQMALARGT